MHEANTALLDILVDNSVIIPSFFNSLVDHFGILFLELNIAATSYIAGILKNSAMIKTS